MTTMKMKNGMNIIIIIIIIVVVVIRILIFIIFLDLLDYSFIRLLVPGTSKTKSRVIPHKISHICLSRDSLHKHLFAKTKNQINYTNHLSDFKSKVKWNTCYQ